MDGVTMRSSSSVEETVAQLERLFARENQRKAEAMSRTRMTAAGLDSFVTVSDEVEPGATPPRRDVPGGRSGTVGSDPDPLRHVALPPHDRTGSGYWGVSLQPKLIAEVLRKRGW
jgi:hypothetical protein